MPQWLHRTTKQLLTSVATNRLPEAEANYIEEPDLSAVTGQPNKYWKITGDTVSLMNASEQAAVDAAELAQQVSDARAAAVAAVDMPNTDVGMRERAMIELHNKRINYVINRLIELQDRVQAMCDSNGAAENMRTAGLAVSISPTSTRLQPAAVQDYKDDINAGNQDS